MPQRTLTSAIVATASLAALCGLASAQSRTPTSEDFELCNRMAKAKVGTESPSGSALPRSTAPGTSGPSTSGSGTSSPGTSGTTGSSSGTSGSGMPSGTSGSGTYGSGTSGSGTSGSGMSGSGSSTSGSSSRTTDHSLSGIDPSRVGDRAYQAVYQDCMRSRGF